ncbi:MAG: 23S rRNA (uracil(1939)-C(5))-methyltransferase RlmD [Lachnospiraceae bacterium]|nr:23S rRNA (uracil(1939)-C(5))-methyltransferase RlmD [Lachnospiraceae bacterium]
MSKTNCPIAKKCGGCQYLNMNYSDQLDKKQKQMRLLFDKYCHIEKIIGMDNPYNYRNKIHRVFHHKKGSEIIAGIYEEGTHNVLPAKECFIEDVRAAAIITDLCKLFSSFKMKAYNEDTGYGLIRHVMIRTGRVTGEIMVVIVTSSPVFPSKNNFAKALMKLHPEITTIVHNINDKKTNMVIGKRNISLYGKGYIEDILCGKKFRISPQSFYQINSLQTEKLYGKAIEYAGLKGDEVVFDAYCGIGTIGIVASDYAGEVIGVELNEDAVKDAVNNAKINNVKNISFYANDAGRFITNFAANNNPNDENSKKINVVFMDPPRNGSSEEFINAVHKLMPEKVIYISCGPDTLARDLKLLCKGDRYKVKKICPVDMFPFTNKCEVVALLEK